jgi:hypothetical protein
MARKNRWAVSPVLLLVIALLSVGTIWQISQLKDDYEKADKRAAVFESRLDRAEAAKQEADLAAAQLAEQVKDLGKTPVVDPSEPVAGPQGEQGRPPTPAEISLAVQSYCSGGRCDGKNPTAAQVAKAVSIYCNERDNCRGATGEQGIPGSDGAEGPQGPGPTNAQVAQAVADYCADGRCKGPQGDPGPSGQTGVVAVNVEGCQELVGKLSLDATYNADTRTITITCT